MNKYKYISDRWLVTDFPNKSMSKKYYYYYLTLTAKVVDLNSYSKGWTKCQLSEFAHTTPTMTIIHVETVVLIFVLYVQHIFAPAKKRK